MSDPVTGINESFKFGSTVYDADDCLQSGAIGDAIQEILIQCGGYNVAGEGPRDVTFTVSMGLAATDVAKINALEPGTTAAMEIHPAGDTFGYIEVISTAAKVISRPINYAVGAFITMDVTFRLNDVTFQAASS
jgi:hypothetical protein